jgi:hypothetical protein
MGLTGGAAPSLSHAMQTNRPHTQARAEKQQHQEHSESRAGQRAGHAHWRKLLRRGAPAEQAVRPGLVTAENNNSVQRRLSATFISQHLAPPPPIPPVFQQHATAPCPDALVLNPRASAILGGSTLCVLVETFPTKFTLGVVHAAPRLGHLILTHNFNLDSPPSTSARCRRRRGSASRNPPTFSTWRFEQGICTGIAGL